MLRSATLTFLTFLIVTFGDAQQGWQRIGAPCSADINAVFGTSRGYLLAGSMTGNRGDVFRSADNGSTWTKITPTLRTRGFNCFAETERGTILAGTSGRCILRSIDNGIHWEEIPQRTDFNTVYCLAVDARARVLAGTGMGIFQSTDDGLTWTTITKNIDLPAISRIVITAEGHILASSFKSGVFRSTNDGTSWTPISEGLKDNAIYSLAISNSGLLIATTDRGGIYRRDIEGHSWYPISKGLPPVVISDIIIGKNGALLAATYGQGIFLSPDNGATWRKMNAGLTSFRVRSLALSPNGTLLAATHGGGVCRSQQGVIRWETMNAGFPSEPIVSLGAYGNGSLIAACNGQVFRSTDIGKSWTGISVGGTGLETYPLAVTLSGRVFAGTRGDGVLTSTVESNTWKQLTTGMKSPVVRALAANSSGKIIASTWDRAIYYSDDNGANWIPVHLQMGFDHFVSFAVDRDGIIYAAANSVTTMGIVHRSTDRGGTWKQIGVLPAFISSLAATPEGSILAGTTNGVYVSSDHGVQWSAPYVAPSSSWITSVSIDSIGYAYLATVGDGLFRSPEPLKGIAPTRLERPPDFVLLQNFSNPFNPTTTFEFSLPRASFTTLTVYDVIGREVDRPIAENLAAGKHAVPWTPHVASGAYFNRLQSGGYITTGKLMYLK